MLVRAVSRGYYGHILREPGQVFKLKPVDGLTQEKIAVKRKTRDKDGNVVESTEIVESGKRVPKHFTVEEQFSPLWMEKIDSKKAIPQPTPTRRGKVGARPPEEDQSSVQKRIAKAEKLMENADADQAAIDAENDEIEAAQAESDESDVI